MRIGNIINKPILKKIAVGAGIMFTVCTFLFFGFVLHIRHQDFKYKKALAQIKNGMTTQEVKTIMGEPERISKNLKHQPVFWNDKAIPNTIGKQLIKFGYFYRITTFFIPITFGITFDKNNLVIGKHRYD